MDFAEALNTDSSRAMMDLIAGAVGNDAAHFKTVFGQMLSKNKQIAMRAARVVDIASENFPGLLIPYINQTVDLLPNLKNSGVKRCMLHALYRYIDQISEDKLGLLVDCCFTWLPQETEDISIRYYSMVILYSIIKKNPDLKNEFVIIVEDMLPNASAGLKSKGSTLLKELKKHSN